MTNERNVAEEICAEYVDTMGKIYYSYFKAYSSRVSKLQVSSDPLLIYIRTNV